MTIGRLMRISAALLICGALTARATTAQDAGSREIVGLISELSGPASITSQPSRSPEKAQRFDAIVVGATLEMGPESRGTIVLVDGRRFELGPDARAALGVTGLASSSGPVSELPRLPTLPRIAALDDSRPQGPAAGVRVRGDVVAGLRPFHAVLATQATTLRFEPVKRASRYEVAVEDDAGRRVFVGETAGTEMVVPAGTLKPGASYHLTVQTVDKVGGAARGSSRFTTLSDEQMRARDKLRQALQAEGGTGWRALLAEIDRRLGLFEEALNGFRAALTERPDDPALQQSVRRLEALEKSR